MLVTIIIPCYNEKNTIKEIIRKILDQKNIKIQIIIVDDCSTDGTVEILKGEIKKYISKIIFHQRNMGKGAAIKSAINHIQGDIIIIQDADLEYDPKDYNKIFNLIDKKIYLKVPNFKYVLKWRFLQEKKLRFRSKKKRTMNKKQIERFIMFYERLTKHMLKTYHKDAEVVINIDKNKYSNGSFLLKNIKNRNYRFHKLDINSKKILNIFRKYKPNAIFNLAAETHVDRSIDNSYNFIKNNILGCYSLLESIRTYKKKVRLIHISTDLTLSLKIEKVLMT